RRGRTGSRGGGPPVGTRPGPPVNGGGGGGGRGADPRAAARAGSARRVGSLRMRHTRAEVVERARREFARLDRLVRRLRPADWKRPVPRPPGRDPWTVKDALAHIVYWKEHTARVIRGERRLPEMRGL